MDNATMDLCCVKCGKKLGVVYYVVDDQQMCQECYYKLYSPSNLLFGWVCPRCGRVNSPYVTQCLCNVNGRIKITYC